MLTDNLCDSDRLINGSVGTVKYLDRGSEPLCSIIYVKSEDLKAGNSLKDGKLCGDLKKYVPITVGARKFPLNKIKSTAIAEKKNYFCQYLAMQLLSISLREVL